MPLVQATLEAQLTALFASPPADAAACGQAWGNALAAYAAPIVPPSLTVSAAANALAGSLAAAFGLPAALPAMETAFGSFAAAVGGGMAGYAPVPPPGPVGFASLPGLVRPASAAAGAQRIAGMIHTWLTTGTATLIAPPYTPLTWS